MFSLFVVALSLFASKLHVQHSFHSITAIHAHIQADTPRNACSSRVVCLAHKMLAAVECPQPFTGVLYTDGGYADVDCHAYIANATGFTFAVPYDRCRTARDATTGAHTNRLILQRHQVMMTGDDVVFTLKCDAPM